MTQTSIREILAERKGTHGDFTENARVHMQLQQVIASAPLYPALTAVNGIALQVILGKIARIVTGNQMHKDSWDDIAGYAMMASDRVHKPEVQGHDARMDLTLHDMKLDADVEPVDGKY